MSAPVPQELENSTTGASIEERISEEEFCGIEDGKPAAPDNVRLNSQAPSTPPSMAALRRATSWKAQLELKEDETCMSHFLRWLDAYKVEERRPDKVGLFVTFVVLPLSLAYCIFFLYQSLHAPDPVTNEVLWATGEGPFSMPVRCEAPGGCLFSNSYQKNPSDCESVAFQEERLMSLAYSTNSLDGPSVMLHSSSSKAQRLTDDSLQVLALADSSTTTIASVLSETNMPMMEKADSDGTFLQWTELLQGTVLMTYVHTLNRTARHDIGKDREEYFPLQLNSDGNLIAGSTPCEAQAAAAEMRQVRIRLHPAMTRIKVEDGFNVWQYIGTCSGQYAALLSWGALVVAVIDVYREYHPH